jgi:hypothetical protein
MAPQFIGVKGAPERWLCLWILAAMSPFSTPDFPVMRMVESTGAESNKATGKRKEYLFSLITTAPGRTGLSSARTCDGAGPRSTAGRLAPGPGANAFTGFSIDRSGRDQYNST